MSKSSGQQGPWYSKGYVVVLSDRYIVPRFKMAGSSWSACPREILVQCFATQADYLDNVSADATCKAWHDALLAAADLITDMSVCDGPLSNQTHLLHKFPNLQTIKIVMAAGSTEGFDFHTDSPNNGQHSQQQAVWLPTSCTCLIMEDFSNAGSSENLSNLQEVRIQAARMPLMSFASLGSLQNLLVLTIAGGREPGQNALITGSIVDLPKGLTQLKLTHCNFSEWVALPEPIAHWSLPPLCLRFGPEASKHLMALQHLELSYLGVDLRGKFADMSNLHMLVLEGSAVQFTADLTFLYAAKALHTLNLSKASFTWQHPQMELDVGQILAALPNLKHLEVTDCVHISLPEYLEANSQLSTLVFWQRDYCDFYFGYIRADLRRETGLDSSLLPAMHATVSKELPKCLCIDWLVHLELDRMDNWPFAKVSDPQNQAASFCNLRTLHFVACCPFLKQTIQIPAAMKLTEFYLSVSLCNSIVVADCTSLRILGIAYSGISRKARLPKSLSKLFWPMPVTATPQNAFSLFTNLQTLHLGHSSFVSLPQLPISLTELDLSGSKVADLTSLPTLTNLQKLTLPATPSPAGLQCLKQTLRLKHVAIVKREGRSLACLLQRRLLNSKSCSWSCIQVCRDISRWLPNVFFVKIVWGIWSVLPCTVSTTC